MSSGYKRECARTHTRTGREYIADNASKILKANGLVMLNDNGIPRIVKIKQYNKVIENYRSALKKLSTTCTSQAEFQAAQIQENKKLVSTLHSFAKEEYWSLLPPSYKSIIVNITENI